MSNENLKPDVKKILSEVVKGRVAPENIADDDILVKTLGIDSIMILEVLVSLEEKYGFSLEEDHLDFESFASVNNIVALINSLRSLKP